MGALPAHVRGGVTHNPMRTRRRLESCRRAPSIGPGRHHAAGAFGMAQKRLYHLYNFSAPLADDFAHLLLEVDSKSAWNL